MSDGAANPGRVFVFGSANHDHVLSVEEFPQDGETVLSRSYSVGFGGKGANQAVAAARAGGAVVFVGAVGADPQGEDVLANFAAHGIDVSGTTRSSAQATGVAVVLVDARGSNKIIVAAGANADLPPETVEAALREVGRDDVVVVQCEIPVARVEQIIRGGACRGATVIVNLAPYTPLARSLFGETDLLIVNESEARALIAAESAIAFEATRNQVELGAALAAAVGCECIVTLGERGSLHAAPDGTLAMVPSVAVDEVVDTTGAGDVFVGTLATALVGSRDVVEAMRAAAAAAARAVSSPGAQAPFPPSTVEAVV